MLIKIIYWLIIAVDIVALAALAFALLAFLVLWWIAVMLAFFEIVGGWLNDQSLKPRPAMLLLIFIKNYYIIYM